MKGTIILMIVIVAAVGNEALFLTCNPALIDCFRDPCAGAICPAYPDAQCRTGCHCQAEWVDLLGHTVTGCFNKG